MNRIMILWFVRCTLTDLVQGSIFQLFHPSPEGRKPKNQPFPSGIQGKKG
jgi:hypothetical protein